MKKKYFLCIGSSTLYKIKIKIMENIKIIELLTKDMGFRNDFFFNPKLVISKNGIELTEEDIAAIEKYDWVGVCFMESKFDDFEVKRC